MGENKFPWVVATPYSFAAKSLQQRMRIAAVAVDDASLLTHKFNVCLLKPLPFLLSPSRAHTRRHD